MNRSDDALEAELATWQPAPVSEELRQRIGEDIVRNSRQDRSTYRLWFWTSSLAAACLLLALGLRPKHEDAELADKPDSVLFDAQLPLPTLSAYSRALTRSPDSLEALLCRHSSSTSLNGVSTSSVHAFHNSNAILQELTGTNP